MNSAQYQPHGRFFEEFEVGETLATPGRTVTEADVVWFCGLSGDYNELHSNAEYAKQTPFGQRIAHGLLGLIVAQGLAGRLGLLEGTAQAFLSLEWKFKRPLLIGDTIYVRASVSRKREAKALQGGILVLDVAVVNQKDEVLQEGTWNVLMKSRPSAAKS
jgi:3-hydroxybutyryl-CoA dehydratase